QRARYHFRAPIVAVKTRFGDEYAQWGHLALRVRLEQLDQYAQPGGRLQERHVAVGARTRRLVNKLDAFVLQVAQVLPDVGGAKAQVMQTRSAALQEPSDRGVRIGGFQELDEDIGCLDERHA